MTFLMLVVNHFCLKDLWIVTVTAVFFLLASIVFASTNDRTSVEIAAVVSTWPDCVYFTVPKTAMPSQVGPLYVSSLELALS